MKLLIVDPLPITQLGCAYLFSNNPEIEIRFATGATEALALIASDCPDIIVLEIDLPDAPGLIFLDELLRREPLTRLIVFTRRDAPAIAVKAIDVGAFGFVSKNGEEDDLRKAVESVRSGKRWISQDLAQELALFRTGVINIPALTTREIEVLRQLSRSDNLKDISQSIGAHYQTVVRDVASLRAKLGARSLFELVRIAEERRVISYFFALGVA